MSNILEAGYAVQLTKKVGDIDAHIHPITRTGNVKNRNGDNMDTIIDEISNKTQNATIDTLGVVQLNDSIDSSRVDQAATANALAKLNTKLETHQDLCTRTTTDLTNKIDDINTVMESTVKNSDIGVIIPELDEDGLIPLYQIPGSVQDVIDIVMSEDCLEAHLPESEGSELISPRSGTIYIDINTRKQYVWSGSAYARTGVGDITIGNTSESAFRGDLGNTAYLHAISNHANVNASVVKDSATNGKHNY